MGSGGPYADLGTLFPRLRAARLAEWEAYTRHPFVLGIADGSLPEAAFKHYLRQDYLFLIHFARAYALAAYKSDTLEDIRAATATVNGLIDVEMRMHVTFCEGWGITEVEMAETPEDTACMAYTRYVLERGAAGDLLDLQVALAPCVIGYGEIGLALAGDAASKAAGNPYAPWIEMYAGQEYHEVARGAVEQLDRLWAARGSEARWPSVQKTFAEATRLEIDFWQMGLDAA